MSTFKLDPESLSVTSFEVTAESRQAAAPAAGVGGGLCCTGCDSGCGIFPTECYCESQGQSDGSICEPVSAVD